MLWRGGSTHLIHAILSLTQVFDSRLVCFIQFAFLTQHQLSPSCHNPIPPPLFLTLSSSCSIFDLDSFPIGPRFLFPVLRFSHPALAKKIRSAFPNVIPHSRWKRHRLPINQALKSFANVNLGYTHRLIPNTTSPGPGRAAPFTPWNEFSSPNSSLLWLIASGRKRGDWRKCRCL